MSRKDPTPPTLRYTRWQAHPAAPVHFRESQNLRGCLAPALVYVGGIFGTLALLWAMCVGGQAGVR